MISFLYNKGLENLDRNPSEMLQRARDSFRYRMALSKQRIRLKQNQSSTQVTIFGSCRQDSLAHYFEVTRIRDGLTYPHYSKEIIQAIEYVKSAGDIRPSTVKVFRNSLLNLRLVNPKKLKKDFDATDVFVVEIASLIEYKKGSDYFHHVAIETISGIQKETQTYDSLKEDIVRIHELLSPKKVLFATHYSTKSNGVRFDLASFIEETCNSLGFETINPSDMNTHWKTSELHIDEDVVSHFSQMGHDIMGGRYREKILTLSFYPSLNPLVQKYRPGIMLKDYHGLGDFIFGSLRTHQEALSYNRLARIDVSEHPMSKFLEPTFADGDDEITPIVNESSSAMFSSGKTIFTHLRPLKCISVADCDFVMRNALTPNKSFQKDLYDYKVSMGIDESRYSIAHIRLGDDYIKISNELVASDVHKLFMSILLYLESLPQVGKHLVSTDSNLLSDYLTEKGVPVLSGRVAHFGMMNPELLAVKDTLMQFFTMRGAQSITQISAYGWGSGFSETAAVLGRVPVKKIRLHEIV